MARLKSEDKRSAILSAATQVFAERGLNAATSAISSEAGVAEGTLFTYFRTKDELVNALYCEIKREMAEIMLAKFPHKKRVRERLQHVWERYVDWGVTNPKQQRVLKQIEVWSGLTDESKTAGSAPFAEIQTMESDVAAQHLSRHLPHSFVAAMMGALAETTIQFVAEDPKKAKVYREAGFEMLWAGVVRKS